MINGAHVIIHSHDAEADRAFFREVLDYPYVDAGADWLIFKLPPAEIAVHPTEGTPSHELYLMCDDLDTTMDELAAKGATLTAVTEARWGRLTSLHLPGGGEVGLRAPTSTGYRPVVSRRWISVPGDRPDRRCSQPQ